VGKKKNISTALSKTWRSEPEDWQKAGEGSGLGGKGNLSPNGRSHKFQEDISDAVASVYSGPIDFEDWY
jgi:hypothetical protein